MTEIAIEHISVAERQRPIDPQVVADLARSIEQHGLLQPIGIKVLDDAYELLFGAHRLAACRALQHETICATVFPETLSAEEGRLLELRENLDRNDLTGVQRKTLAAEVGRLIAILQSENPVAIGNEKWLINLAMEANIPTKTMYNWWAAFCRSSSLNLKPKQATKEQQDQFFDWLTAQQQRQQEEQARQFAETTASQRATAFQEALEYLNRLATDWGLETVKQEVITPWLNREF